jgi:protein TonB
MFEDSTFESTGAIHTRSRRWMLVTLTFNGSVLLALILLPLIYPEALPGLFTPILMTAPPPLAEEPKPQLAAAHSVVTHPQFAPDFQMPSRIPRRTAPGDGPAGANRTDFASLGSDAMGTASPDNPWSGQRPVVVVQQPQTHVHVSQGVMSGLLLDRVLPVYPAIAKAVRAEGTVVLQATISKSGTIENLRVVSGQALLQQAAIDAVRQWRYRPYLLNGAPVAVETTVNVVFRLN